MVVVKELIINSKSSISLQKHHHRAEHWMITQGKPKITINKNIYYKKANESVFIGDSHTDFEAAYMHILNMAKKHNVIKSSMPTMLLVLSDMQFDDSQHDMPHYGHMKDEYERCGYDFPKLVFWNLACYPGTPAQCSDDSVAMVSGFSPSIMKCCDFVGPRRSVGGTQKL